jgi:hypothetical protein
LSFIACLAHANIKMLSWDNYLVRVSFVPESALNDAIMIGIRKHDAVIIFGYEQKFFSKERLTAYGGKLLSLAYQSDEQGGKFVIDLFGQIFPPQTIMLANDLQEIVDEQIGRLLYLDIGGIKNERIKSEVDELSALRRRYLQGLTIVENFYGIEKNIKFHQNFLSELTGEEEDRYWIDEMIQIHAVPKKKKIDPNQFELMRN